MKEKEMSNYVKERLSDDRIFVSASLVALIFIMTFGYSGYISSGGWSEFEQVLTVSGYFLIASFILAMVSLKIGKFVLENDDKLFKLFKVIHFLTYVAFLGSIVVVASFFFKISLLISYIVVVIIFFVVLFFDFYPKSRMENRDRG